MKLIAFIITVFSYLSTTVALAQETPNLDYKKKMEVFANWTGQWKGEGMVQRGPQNSSKSNVVENIEMKLDGSIVVVEGRGTLIDPETKKEKIVHHAFGVLCYDTQLDNYRFETYLTDGKSTQAWFNIVGDNKYQWGFDVPQGKIRYTITIDPNAKTWQEIGEYSRDEQTWYKTFEMNLKKV